jgi:hypothetical protein
MKKYLLIIIFGLICCLPVSAYEVGEDVYLNACGNDPQEYYGKPLNIQNILIEVPNKIIKVEKSKYDREFQTLASSEVKLDNDNITISVSNFRDLVIKNKAGDILEERKISGASSIYELKHNDKVVAWGVGWHVRCKKYFSDADFTALRIFLPVKKNNKISIEQKLISLNLTDTYEAIINSDNLIIADAFDIEGSSRAATYYYEGQKFYQFDHINGISTIDTYADLIQKIDFEKLSAIRQMKVLADYYETEKLYAHTKENFDEIYKELLVEGWDIFFYFDHYDFDNERLNENFLDINLSDKFKKALLAYENKELLNEDFPPISEELPNIKENCFKKESYESLRELVKNCYFFHSSYLLEWGFDDPKWFAVQTDFKDSKDLLNEDKEQRFKQFLESNVTDMKSIVRGKTKEDMDHTLVEALIGIFERANGGYNVSEDKRYVVISGCEYKSCGTKGLVFIDTEAGNVISLIRHFDYDADIPVNKQPGEWLISSTWHNKYKDLPKEFMDAVVKWRVNEDLPQPSIIRYVGGFNDEIELVKSSKDE